MNKTNIEWAKNPDGSQGYTWNPVTGCLNHVNGLCKGGGFPCYAYKLANRRLSSKYLAGGIIASEGEDHENLSDPFYPRFWEDRLTPLHTPRRAGSPKKGIFVCDMGDLFGMGIPEEWTNQVLNAIKANPDYRFYLLTKQPQNLIKFSPFPKNCWVGVTVTGIKQFHNAINGLAFACKDSHNVRFISFEPLLSPLDIDPELLPPLFQFVDWLIIGACTGSFDEMAKLCSSSCREHTLTAWSNKWTAQPPIEWLQEIVEAADKAGIKVFLKDNLNPMFADNDCAGFNQYKDQLFTVIDNFPTRYHLRQEMPNTKEAHE